MTDFINDKIKAVQKKIDAYLTGQWTVRDYNTKKDICTFDTMLSYSYEANSELPSYPIQQGSFMNYNKINNPNKSTITLAISGNKEFLQKQLAKLETYSSSIDLVDLVLPFRYYIGYNLCNLSHSMGEKQAISMLIVKFDLIEIRQSIVLFKKTKPKYKKTSVTGKTNPQVPPKQSLIKGAFNNLF